MRGDVAGDREPHLPESCDLRLAHQGQGQAGSPAGDDGDPGRLVFREPALGESFDQFGHGDPPHVDGPASGGHRRREVVLGSRHQKKHRLRRRLLEGLEQGIGGLLRHGPRIREQKHAPGRLDGGEGGTGDNLTGLVDTEAGGALRLENAQIGMGPHKREASSALVAFPAEQPGGKAQRHRLLADRFRADE